LRRFGLVRLVVASEQNFWQPSHKIALSLIVDLLALASALRPILYLALISDIWPHLKSLEFGILMNINDPSWYE